MQHSRHTSVTSSPMQYSSHTSSTPTQCIQSLLNLSPSVFGRKSETPEQGDRTSLYKNTAMTLPHNDLSPLSLSSSKSRQSPTLVNSSRSYSKHSLNCSPQSQSNGFIPPHDTSISSCVRVQEHLDATVLSQALRALATVCCVPESLQQLDEVRSFSSFYFLISSSFLSTVSSFEIIRNQVLHRERSH